MICYDRLWRLGANRSGGTGRTGWTGWISSAVAWLSGGTSGRPACRRARAVSSPRSAPCLALRAPVRVRINGNCNAQCG
jgi:hypothetical protein